MSYIDSMIVIRHGYIVAEAYYDPIQMDDPHQLYSASKSFISALIGIAIEQGYIESVDEKVLDLYADYEVENVDARKEAMTIRDLLRMSSGFECDGFSEIGPNGVYDSNDSWVQGTLNLPMMAEPGAEFHYCDPNTTLLSGLINEKVGMSALEYAQENLFAPLGITNAAWTADAQGVNFGASELQLTPRDMAKFGFLYLHNGEWDGQQIVPAEWVKASTGMQMKDVFGPGFHYGYQFWYMESINMYMALGAAGQYIFVWPDKDLIFIGTSATPESYRIAHTTFPIIFRIDALMVADEALPENAEKMAQLEAAVEAVSTPMVMEVGPLPDVVSAINGQTYNLFTKDLMRGVLHPKFAQIRSPLEIGPAWYDVSALSLAFDDTAEATLTVTYADGEAMPVLIGLDNVYRRSELRDGVVAAKGRWLDADTFRVYIKIVNDLLEYRIDLSFASDILEAVNFEISGGKATAAYGMMAPPAE